MPPDPIAHSPNRDDPAETPHFLREHLPAVAELAAGFAAGFGGEAYARIAGLWHDLGKNDRDIQQILQANDQARLGIDHKHAGALHAVDRLGPEAGLPLAFAIVGHHGGMPDHTDLFGPRHLACPEYRDRLKAILAAGDQAYLPPEPAHPGPPPYQSKGTPDERRRFEFWVRMLFSCLVDADGLDTEAFRAGDKAQARRAALARYPKPPELLVRLNDSLAKKAATAAGSEAVNAARAEVLRDCRAAATAAPGVFTLTAPTGAGKTLAGMAFALEHAVVHGKDRVIVVIPYTSIIDQNAAVYRDVFGAGNVIDHHASLDPAKETPENKLACENWDAPVVVTTSVQFVESLFANSPARCRKLHNVCDSVVIFDEVQTLPVGHLDPIVDALKELVRGYGVTLVLSTATQPALRRRASNGRVQFDGFEGATEIVRNVDAVFGKLRRVAPIRWPASLVKPADADAAWAALAVEVRGLDEVLVVTHKRADARELAGRMPEAVHLSALMCPAHRLEVIRRIKAALAENRRLREGGEKVVPLRVVTTQLVEAGVDIDFPIVYRAFGGLDSIAQAAGRCNREGLLGPGGGEVRVFVAPTDPPPGMPSRGRDEALEMLADDPALDPLNPGLYDEFFRGVYRNQNLDRANVLNDRSYLRFAAVAENFRMIDEDGQDVVVIPFGSAGEAAIAALREKVSRDTLRGVQPFVVKTRNAADLERAGAIDRLGDGAVAVLRSEYSGLYDPVYGLKTEGPYPANPGAYFS